jgi:HPt (histidine-containing phosphotransfer) domain-containing protein
MELDLDRVRMIADPSTADGRALLGELLEAYGAHARTSLTALRDAIAAGDASRVRALAHEQKGAGGMIGAAGIAAAFALIERSSSDAAAARAAIDDITAALDRLAADVTALDGRPGLP